MNIRLLEEKDFDEIIRILIETNSVHNSIRPDIFKEGSAKYSHSDLRQIMLDEQQTVFVAEIDAKLAGYIFLQDKGNPETNTRYKRKILYIDDLGVEKAFRGQKVATTLFDKAVSYAKENGYDSITLNCYEGNEEALSFYKKMGMDVLYYQFEKKLY